MTTSFYLHRYVLSLKKADENFEIHKEIDKLGMYTYTVLNNYLWENLTDEQRVKCKLPYIYDDFHSMRLKLTVDQLVESISKYYLKSKDSYCYIDCDDHGIYNLTHFDYLAISKAVREYVAKEK